LPNQQWKGWCEMVSKALGNKRLFASPNKRAKALIDIQVRRLVMLMRSIELDGVMGRDDTELAVIDAFEKAERLYYGMSEDEFASIIDIERGNANARKSNNGRI